MNSESEEESAGKDNDGPLFRVETWIRRRCHRGQGEKGITRERTEDTEDEQLAVETSLPGIKFPVEVVAQAERALERLQTRGEFRPHPFPVDRTAPPNYQLALSTSPSLPNIQRQVALHGR